MAKVCDRIPIYVCCLRGAVAIENFPNEVIQVNFIPDEVMTHDNIPRKVCPVIRSPLFHYHPPEFDRMFYKRSEEWPLKNKPPFPLGAERAVQIKNGSAPSQVRLGHARQKPANAIRRYHAPFPNKNPARF
jgi:hypothetical protein